MKTFKTNYLWGKHLVHWLRYYLGHSSLVAECLVWVQSLLSCHSVEELDGISASWIWPDSDLLILGIWHQSACRPSLFPIWIFTLQIKKEINNEKNLKGKIILKNVKAFTNVYAAHTHTHQIHMILWKRVQFLWSVC